MKNKKKRKTGRFDNCKVFIFRTKSKRDNLAEYFDVELREKNLTTYNNVVKFNKGPREYMLIVYS